MDKELCSKATQQREGRHLSAHHNMDISLVSIKEAALCTHIFSDTSQLLKPGHQFYLLFRFTLLSHLSIIYSLVKPKNLQLGAAGLEHSIL